MNILPKMRWNIVTESEKNFKRIEKLKRIRQRDIPYISGPIIKKLRKKHGLTQEQLALRIGISRSMVGNWEACLRAPRIDHYCALAKIFHIEIEDLYDPMHDYKCED